MDAINYDQAEEGVGTQRWWITIQDIMSHCNVPPFKAHITVAWLKRDDLPDMYFWASKSLTWLSKRNKSLHGRWLQPLNGRCIITQELNVQILDNGEAVYRNSEKGKDISLSISGEPDKNACDEQTSSKIVQESFQDLSVADYNSQTPTKMVEYITWKCFSDPSQKLKGGLKKHQRSFEQGRSILATRQHLARIRSKRSRKTERLRRTFRRKRGAWISICSQD